MWLFCSSVTIWPVCFLLQNKAPAGGRERQEKEKKARKKREGKREKKKARKKREGKKRKEKRGETEKSGTAKAEKRRYDLIQEIGAHRYNNTWNPLPPGEESYVLFYREKQALILRQGEEIRFPRVRDVLPQNPDFCETYTYLFAIDEDRFYLADPETFQLPDLPGQEMVNVGSFRSASPRSLAFAGITGHQLADWYQSRRFCGHCGRVLKPGSKERMLYCTSCGQIEYPKISPAVIVGVTDGDRLLLTKYAGRDFKNYALIAGFCEIGESLEDTIHREVMEEVGLKVTNLRYYKSQPWSFSETLLSGFFCDLAEPGQIRLQEEELALAEWFDRENLPLNDPFQASLTQDMITAFHEGRA